jgi:hypothetical protein
MTREEVNAQTSSALLRAFSPANPADMERELESALLPAEEEEVKEPIEENNLKEVEASQHSIWGDEITDAYFEAKAAAKINLGDLGLLLYTRMKTAGDVPATKDRFLAQIVFKMLTGEQDSM